MKLIRYFTLITVLSLAFSGIGRADPIIALASLLLANKVTGNKSENQFKNTTHWRDLLDVEEQNALNSMQNNPAIHTCIQRMQQGDPVAEYHLRKIASFSVRLKAYVQNQNSHDVLREIAYKRAAKGYSWCMRQAGIQAVHSANTLKLHARLLARAVLEPSGGVKLAMKDRLRAE